MSVTRVVLVFSGVGRGGSGQSIKGRAQLGDPWGGQSHPRSQPTYVLRLSGADIMAAGEDRQALVEKVTVE